MVTCLISSTSMTVKWDAFTAEKGRREEREKIRVTLTNQDEDL